MDFIRRALRAKREIKASLKKGKQGKDVTLTTTPQEKRNRPEYVHKVASQSDNAPR